MPTFLKAAFRRIFILALVLLLMLAAIWMVSRAIYPNQAQRQAMAELEHWPEYEGQNAFALLWTMNRAVPDDALARVMAEDVQTLSLEGHDLLDKSRVANRRPGENFESAADAYTGLSVSDADRERFCGSLEPDCLQRVRNDLETYTALVERHAQLLERVDKLHEYGYIRSEFPYSLWAPIPNFSPVYLPQTRHAVNFASGERLAAVAGTCRDILTWRRLGSRSDGLIQRMSGIAVSSRDNGRLLASMLAELPIDEPLPEPCREALAPPTDLELSTCNAMRGEFGINADLVRNNRLTPDENIPDRLARKLLYDPEASLGRRAEGFLAFCEADKNDVDTAQQRKTLKSHYANIWRLECAGDLMSCALDSLSLPAYGEYQDRVTDHGAQLRALGTLAWMRQHADLGKAPAELLASRPAALNNPGDQLSFTPDGQSLRITLRYQRRDEYWEIPLPPALHDSRQG